ncbi:copper resistance CopC family protein [Cytobacillus oceanisediminis]|uniref:copper resistance CopC family protein n=1 Tax=Cytobacillus oceanisediminis TaxID=665099 RepID=UPI001C242E49|nr:copper resistance CopC family protein [Cytobacillus oceanisediminis]MBU8772655.1 copper resistance protein CopC [Cytobacillus oceanisediminis]
MNKILMSFLCFFIILPSMATAHTGLESSTPKSGQIVTEDLNEITLTFAGEIESLSTMTLVMEGQEIPFSDVEPNGKQMSGTLEAPLENGSYVIRWSIVGEDGHQITGEIPFTVKSEENTSQESEMEESQISDEEKMQTEETEKSAESEKESSPNRIMNIFIPILTLAVLVLGLFLLFRRKR